MPLYEYLCESCGHRFERIQKFSDPIASECPTCGGPVQKLISSPAIQFKGSGFYITDYAKSDKTGESAASKETPSSGSSESAGSSTGDKADKAEKPAASSDSSPAKAPPASTEKSTEKK